MSPTRPARVASLVVALLLPLGLVACSDADDSAEVVGEASTTEAADTTVDSDASTITEGPDDTTTTEGSTPTIEAEGGGTSGDLREALLTVDDLPPGHVQDGDDDTSGSTLDDDEPLCAGAPSHPFPTRVEQIEREFGTEDLTSLVQSVAIRLDGDQANGLAFYRSELVRCGGLADDGFGYEHRDLPGIGDEALEITLFDAEEPDSGSVLVYFARVDDVLVGVSIVAAPTVAIDGEALLRTMVGRL